MNLKNKLFRLTFTVAGMFTLATSCIEPDYLTYDEDYKGLYFSADTLRYSFGVTPTEVREKVYRIPVELVGCLNSENRELPFIIVKDSCTAIDGIHCTVGDAYIEADSIRGYIPVTIHRDSLEGNYQNGFVNYRLELRLVKGNGFTPTMSPEQQVCVLFFDNAVDQPEWHNYKGDKVWSETYFGVWHPLKLIKMVEYFHEIANTRPDSYKKMAELYGENLEHVPFGDFYQYKLLMKKYVFEPMYDYFSSRENHDEIVALYPDFPFDFPNPYSW